MWCKLPVSALEKGNNRADKLQSLDIVLIGKIGREQEVEIDIYGWIHLGKAPCTCFLVGTRVALAPVHFDIDEGEHYFVGLLYCYRAIGIDDMRENSFLFGYIVFRLEELIQFGQDTWYYLVNHAKKVKEGKTIILLPRVVAAHSEFLQPRP